MRACLSFFLGDGRGGREVSNSGGVSGELSSEPEIAADAGDNEGIEVEGVVEDSVAARAMAVDAEEEPLATGAGVVEVLLAAGADEVEGPLATGTGEGVLAEEPPAVDTMVADTEREPLATSAGGVEEVPATGVAEVVIVEELLATGMDASLDVVSD